MSSRYAWIIDQIIGPRNAPDDLVAQLKEGLGIPFRLFDDEDNLCHEGRILVVRDDGTTDLGEEHFAPLDDFGEPDSGCTYIQYGPPWETL